MQMLSKSVQRVMHSESWKILTELVNGKSNGITCISVRFGFHVMHTTSLDIYVNFDIKWVVIYN